MIFNKINIIINPASGQPQPILSIIHRVLHECDLDWDISITHQDGHGKQLAEDAIRQGADLIVAYGGDGTVKDVINGLVGSDVPLAVLPGGTGNALAHELKIPMDLTEALSLVLDGHQLQALDVGKAVSGDQTGYFILRANVGMTTEVVDEANREEKDRFGNLAYLLASLKSLAGSEPLTFHLNIDGQEIEGRGLTCIVANSAAVGGPHSFHFASDVSFCDGLLDVLIFDTSLNAVASVISSNVNMQLASLAQRWQGREIEVNIQLPQPVRIDGEEFGETPVSVSVISQAVRVLVPSKDGM